MSRVAYVVFSLALSLTAIACGKDGPTAPSPSEETRILVLLGGDINFGNVPLNTSVDRTFTIRNDGTGPLTVSSLSGPFASAMALSWTGGVIPAGASQTITIRFTPTEAQTYTGVIRVNADETSGNDGINFIGVGIRTGPLWTVSGTGDNVFDIPPGFSRVQIEGRYTRNSQNFIVRIGGRLLVNELMGTFWDQTYFVGTYQITSGRTVEITGSSGVAWTLPEVR
jgi:hypothetical protein